MHFFHNVDILEIIILHLDEPEDIEALARADRTLRSLVISTSAHVVARWLVKQQGPDAFYGALVGLCGDRLTAVVRRILSIIDETYLSWFWVRENNGIRFARTLMSRGEVGALSEIMPSCWKALRHNDPNGCFIFKRVCQVNLEAEAGVGNVRIIQMLVRVCADICPDYDAVCPLTEAVRTGKVGAVRELINLPSIDPNARPRSRALTDGERKCDKMSTLLLYAIWKGNERIVLQMLRCPRTDVKTTMGTDVPSPLEAARQMGMLRAETSILSRLAT